MATATSGLPAFWHVTEWWNQPIVYQKLILWTVLLEAIGVAGSWGPLAGKIKPMTGGISSGPGRARSGCGHGSGCRSPTVTGARRSTSGCTWHCGEPRRRLVRPGVTATRSRRFCRTTLRAGRPACWWPHRAAGVIGLRDKTIFLAARGEQYFPALVFFAVLGVDFTDMIVALKMLIVVVWVGAGFSKFGKHFSRVVPPMVSNSPFIPVQVGSSGRTTGISRRDMRPSRVADFMAMSTAPGRDRRAADPVFSTNKWVTLAAALLMVGFHLFIISTFPLAVPLEWNMYSLTPRCFCSSGSRIGADTRHGTCRRHGWRCHRRRAAVLSGSRQPAAGQGLVPAVAAAVRRQLGVGGVGVRARRGGQAGPGHPLGAGIRSTSSSASVTNRNGPRSPLQKTIAWRTMHSQGRGLFSLLVSHLPDIAPAPCGKASSCAIR